MHEILYISDDFEFLFNSNVLFIVKSLLLSKRAYDLVILAPKTIRENSQIWS